MHCFHPSLYVLFPPFRKRRSYPNFVFRPSSLAAQAQFLRGLSVVLAMICKIFNLSFILVRTTSKTLFLTRDTSSICKMFLPECSRFVRLQLRSIGDHSCNTAPVFFCIFVNLVALFGLVRQKSSPRTFCVIYIYLPTRNDWISR